jgi:sugar lactone lactonase YvrE
VTEIVPLPGVAPCALGESPFWHPEQGALWWCDIPGRALHRWHAATAEHRRWELPTEPGCIAPLRGGALLVAQRDGIVRFDPATGTSQPLAAAPYDRRHERFNDGRADAQGRLWVATIYEPRDAAAAALYRFDQGRLERIAGDITVGNGIAWGPDGRTLYFADTKAHRIDAFDFDGASGTLSRRRSFARFAEREAGQSIEAYGGRPDGAAVDAEGAYWVAMFEGQRLLRLGAGGELLDEIELPVRCPTMPCFGGSDLKTLFITTARDKRGADELAAQALAGCVLMLRVNVPGLPVNFAR